MAAREVVVVSGARTAIGDYGSALKDVPATKLGSIAIREAVARAKIDPATVGHVVLGSVVHGEARDMYISRVAAVDAGIPVGTPCLTVNRLCGSGLQAIVSASQHILLGDIDVAIGAGAESMSRAAYFLPTGALGPAHGRRPDHRRDGGRAHRPVRHGPHGHHRREPRRQARLHARGAGRLLAGIAPPRRRGHRRRPLQDARSSRSSSRARRAR